MQVAEHRRLDYERSAAERDAALVAAQEALKRQRVEADDAAAQLQHELRQKQMLLLAAEREKETVVRELTSKVSCEMPRLFLISLSLSHFLSLSRALSLALAPSVMQSSADYLPGRARRGRGRVTAANESNISSIKQFKGFFFLATDCSYESVRVSAENKLTV